MARDIFRSGNTPEFYDFLIRNSLVPESGNYISTNLSIQTDLWIYIPNYQRGVSWKTSFINEVFLQSNSKLLGHMILAEWRFDSEKDERPWVKELEKYKDKYYHLLDGLQRFATGTMLLHSLFSNIWKMGATHSRFKDKIELLMNQIGTKTVVFEHNHHELLNHPRNAINDQYKELNLSYNKWLVNFLDKSKPQDIEEYFNKIQSLFFEKQLAVDPFSGFTNITDIMNVFLGVNTVRIELNEIDLIRSYIIEKGTSTWTASQLEKIENRFNNLFIARTLPKQNLLPFAILILESIQEKYHPSLNLDIANILPSYNKKFKLKDVEDLLEFIEKMEDYHNSELLDEIRKYHNPYCVVLCHYYRYFIDNKKLPDFLKNNAKLNPIEEQEIYLLYRSMIRTIIYRQPGKIKDKVCQNILHETSKRTMIQISDDISSIVTRGGLSIPLNSSEIEIELREISIGPAKMIFNALTLNELRKPISFNAMAFGSKSGDFHIDHLKPKSKLIKGQKGYKEGDKIGNFAPIPYYHNVIAKMTACSDKLKHPNGLYVSKPDITIIDFNDFLINTHARSISPITNLDDQDLLAHNTPNSISDFRIKKIAKELVKRI